jgi:hypothetical protein
MKDPTTKSGTPGASAENTGDATDTDILLALFRKSLAQMVEMVSPCETLLVLGATLDAAMSEDLQLESILNTLDRLFPGCPRDLGQGPLFEFQATLEAWQGFRFSYKPLVSATSEFIQDALSSSKEPWGLSRSQGLEVGEVATLGFLLSRYLRGHKETRVRECLPLFPTNVGFAQALLRLSSRGKLASVGWIRFEMNCCEDDFERDKATGGRYLRDVIKLGVLTIDMWLEEGFGPEEKTEPKLGEAPIATRVISDSVHTKTSVPSDDMLSLILPDEPWFAIADALNTFLGSPDNPQIPPPSFLLTGAPGTGKSFAARAMAGTLKCPLHTWSLVRLLDPYVGRTEQNIHSAFKVAEDEKALLFFDEVDSLCWDRQEARRVWESSMTNTMLLMLERRKTPVVLATNLACKLDEALMRRIDIMVEFPLPGKIERERLWTQILKPFRWGSEVNLSALVEVPLSGGLILNAARATERKMRMGRVKEDAAAIEVALLVSARAEAPKLGAKGSLGTKPIGFRDLF